MIGRIQPRVAGLTLAGLFLAYTLAGFFLVPALGKKILAEKLEQALSRPVNLESMAFNPYTLSGEIKGMAVLEKDRSDFIRFNSFKINFSILSVFKLSPVISGAVLDSPVVNLSFLGDNQFNFSDLIPDTGAKGQDKEAAAAWPGDIFPFSLSKVKIINGRVGLKDLVGKTEHLVENLDLELDLLSSFKRARKTHSRANLNFSLNKSAVNISIKSLPFDPGMATTMTLKTDALDLNHFLPYLPVPDSIKVKDLGRAGLDLGLDFSLAHTKAGVKGELFSNQKASLVLEGTGAVEGVVLVNPDDSPLAAVPGFFLAVASSDILAGVVKLSGITLTNPKIHLVRASDGSINIFNLAAFDQGGEDAVPAADAGISGLTLELGRGTITGGEVFFADHANKRPFSTSLSGVSVQVNDLKVKDEASGLFSMTGKTLREEEIFLNGQFAYGKDVDSVFSIDGNLEVNRILLDAYAPYYESFLGVDIKKGKVEAATDFKVKINQENIGVITHGGRLEMTGLHLQDRNDNGILLSMPKLNIAGAGIDLEQGRVALGKVSTSDGVLNVKRKKDGSVNWAEILTGKVSTDQPSPDKMEQVRPWDIQLETFSLDRYNLNISDEIPKEMLDIAMSEISIHADNVKSLGGEKAGFRAGLTWNEKGKIAVKGDIVPSLIKADLDVFVEGLPVNDLVPYFSDYINIMVTKGSLQTKGKLGIGLDKKADPHVRFTGKIFLTDFVSLDKETNDLFKFNSFYLSGMDLSLFPLRLEVKDISLTDFYARAILSDRGELNLKSVVSKGESSGDRVEKTLLEKAVSAIVLELDESIIDISNITVQGGDINFTDNLSQPNFTANLKKITGRITGFSSRNQEPAKISLQGVHGHSSPLDITGKLRPPIGRERLLELDVSFKDIELAKFTPYSAKYIGYEIEKGKLIIDLEYRILGSRLESNNRLFFDQLTLGESVESDDATSLPVALAVSLLKNSDDQIDLDIPVSGDLNDPEFSYAAVVMDTFGNLIMKVVAAPFKFIGSMFGLGDDLGFVSFEYGSFVITDKNREKLDQLIQVLVKKPELKLEIQGTYDKLRDAEALREQEFEKMLKSRKLLDAKKGTGVSIEDITILPGEKPGLIEALYQGASFAKPRGEDGKEKQVDLKEKEKLLITNIRISEFDLKTLALLRSEQVKSHLISFPEIASERIFLKGPDPAETTVEESRYAKVNFLVVE